MSYTKAVTFCWLSISDFVVADKSCSRVVLCFYSVITRIIKGSCFIDFHTLNTYYSSSKNHWDVTITVLNNKETSVGWQKRVVKPSWLGAITLLTIATFASEFISDIKNFLLITFFHIMMFTHSSAFRISVVLHPGSNKKFMNMNNSFLFL